MASVAGDLPVRQVVWGLRSALRIRRSGCGHAGHCRARRGSGSDPDEI